MLAASPLFRTSSCEERANFQPAVMYMPATRLRASFCPGVGNSVETFDQSQPSSSAVSWARPVSVPWPISDLAMRMTTLSSGLITAQALTSGVASAASAGSSEKPTVRPAPAAAVPMTNARRSSFGESNFGICVMTAPPLRVLGRRMDGGADTLVGSAAANIGHCRVNIGIGRLRVLLEQRSRGHHHAALAIAALRHVEVEPGLLHRMQFAVLGQSLDGGDLLGADGSNRHLARARGDAVDVHGAGAALSDAAAVFGANQSDRIAQHPKQRRVGFGIDVVGLSVDGKGNHISSSRSVGRASPCGIAELALPSRASLPRSNSNAKQNR